MDVMEEENCKLLVLLHQSLLRAEHHNHFHLLIINHLKSYTHIITTRETMMNLWGVVVDSFCFCVDISSLRRSMLVNLLNCDCLFSNLGVGKDHPLQHPVAEGHTAAAN